MIIYPAIIILILLVCFFVVWRRAYFVQANGAIDESNQITDESARPKEPKGSSRSSAPPSKLLSLKKDEMEVFADNSQDPLMEKAEELFFKKQYISAEKWYLEVIKKEPRNPKIYSRLGLIYINQKNYKDAICCLEEASKIEPGVASRYFNLSFAQNEEGDRKSAIANARKAFRADSQNKKYKRWYDELRSRPF